MLIKGNKKDSLLIRWPQKMASTDAGQQIRGGREMKKLLLIVMVLILVACQAPSPSRSSGPSPSEIRDENCQKNWDHLEVKDDEKAWTINMLLNNVHAPDSVGAFLKICIEDGWDGWRDS